MKLCSLMSKLEVWKLASCWVCAVAKENQISSKVWWNVDAGCWDLLMLSLSAVKAFKTSSIEKSEGKKQYTNYLYKCNFILFSFRYFAFHLSARSHLRVKKKWTLKWDVFSPSDWVLKEKIEDREKYKRLSGYPSKLKGRNRWKRQKMRSICHFIH